MVLMMTVTHGWIAMTVTVCLIPPVQAVLNPNGIDDDSDNTIDCADSDCLSDPACAVNSEAACNDGLDNDGDGSTDWQIQTVLRIRLVRQVRTVPMASTMMGMAMSTALIPTALKTPSALQAMKQTVLMASMTTAMV